ncbi:MAG: hypothetical protein KF891_03405 [Rhizobacter sp.]|nr:hypothetical protein [Rhizobacter sp.]
MLGGLSAAALLLVVAGCGGGSPLTNPPDITNEQVTGGETLSFKYYQECINPVFKAALPIPGSASLTNTCAASGCHNSLNSSGGALRLIFDAQPVADLSTPDTVRTGADMYKNFISAKGVTVIGNPGDSRLITKPRLVGVAFHGGGLIFDSDADVNVQLFRYWISHPVPAGQDEFSTALDVAIVKDSSGKCIPQ